MLTALRQSIAASLRTAIERLYGLDLDPVLEIPPRRELGDLAATPALQLARELKRNPRQIAAEIAAAVGALEGVREITVEGPGYVNFHLDRTAAAGRLLDGGLVSAQRRGSESPKVIVEHTNINPNKAAHIGHLRNAVLGDVLIQGLRATGHEVEAQNYIDDTGVQLADVVVGLVDLRGLDAAQIAALPEPFDYYCWDLYAEVGAWFEEDPARQQLRRQTLHEMESGSGERAEIAGAVAGRVVQRHLATMRRLGIRYDLLTHESEILRLEFFARAFAQLQQSGAVNLEEGGKNAGCWVMPLADSQEFEGLEDPDKVIVRSDGTVTYVGKDIAYQMWKFGLLERDFEYRYWGEESLWQTAPAGEGAAPPSFGHAQRVINVIDARQSYLQRIVRAGLEAMGYEAQAAASIHFAYEMVALSAKAARTLGVETEDGDKAALMSGRKGIGVKADDLIDQLVERSREEIASRNRELDGSELDRLSEQIAVAALRLMMTKATTTRVINFDFDEALNFEGETGPYLQYSLVRVRNIQRRLAEAGVASQVTADEIAALPAEVWADDLWDLVLFVAQIPEVVARAVDTLEISLIARHALDLAKRFHGIYHKHPILQEENEALRTARLATMAIFDRGLRQLLGILGIPVPERM